MSALRVSVLLDENCERQVISYIEKAGHSGEHVVDVLNPGVDDAEDIPHTRNQTIWLCSRRIQISFKWMGTTMPASFYRESPAIGLRNRWRNRQNSGVVPR